MRWGQGDFAQRNWAVHSGLCAWPPGYRLILACLKPTIDALLALPPLAPPPSATPAFLPTSIASAVLPSGSPALLGSAAVGGVKPVSYFTRVQEDRAASDDTGKAEVGSVATLAGAAQVNGTGMTDVFRGAPNGRRRRRQRLRRRAKLLSRS